jgi:hypothetical protein
VVLHNDIEVTITNARWLPHEVQVDVVATVALGWSSPVTGL